MLLLWTNLTPSLRSVESTVSQADSLFSQKKYKKALGLYLKAGLLNFQTKPKSIARLYREEFGRKTAEALTSRRNAYDWRNTKVAFVGVHTFNRLGEMYSKGLGVEVDFEVNWSFNPF